MINRINYSHGGQRSVVNAYGETQAVEQVGHDGRVEWRDLGGVPLAAHEVLDMLAPPISEPKTLVMTFDVTGLRDRAINSLIAEISAQAEANDDHPDVAVGAEIIIDGDLQHAAGVLVVGAGL